MLASSSQSTPCETEKQERLGYMEPGFLHYAERESRDLARRHAARQASLGTTSSAKTSQHRRARITNGTKRIASTFVLGFQLGEFLLCATGLTSESGCGPLPILMGENHDQPRKSNAINKETNKWARVKSALFCVPCNKQRADSRGEEVSRAYRYPLLSVPPSHACIHTFVVVRSQSAIARVQDTTIEAKTALRKFLSMSLLVGLP